MPAIAEFCCEPLSLYKYHKKGLLVPKVSDLVQGRFLLSEEYLWCITGRLIPQRHGMIISDGEKGH